MSRSPQVAARRLRQTLQFRNAPRVLFDVASSQTPWRREELVFRLRGGSTITAPNHPGARVPIYEIFVEDAYRLNELTAGLRHDLVALDIGGHVGCFSVALARHEPRATIHTFEASPVTVEWLRRNVENNHIGDRVHPHHSAITDHTGTLAFADNGRGSGLNGITAPAGSAVAQVPCITFDEAVARAGGVVDLVKMDTEGAEYDIVLASSPEAWSTVQRVVIEHHRAPGHHVSELENFLAAAGLTVVHRVGTEQIGGLWLARRKGGAA